MGGGGSQLGGYGGGGYQQEPYQLGAPWQSGPAPAKPSGFQLPGGLGGGNINQAQQNYIQNQGQLPPGLGGGAVSQAQQNFLSNQQPTQVPQGWGVGGPAQAQFPAGAGQGNTPGMNNDFMDVLQRMFGSGNMPGGAWTGGTPMISFPSPSFGGAPYRMF